MHAPAWRLTGDQDAGARIGLQDRPGAKWQVRCANLTGANLFQQRTEGRADHVVVFKFVCCMFVIR